jgi:hypothetical protein
MDIGPGGGYPPPFGYGYGASQFAYDVALPGTSYPQTPYPAQMYGRDSNAELHGFQLGSFTDTINSIVGGIQSAATNVENIARGVAVGAQATKTVAGRIQSGGSTIFQPSAADIAARNYDVTTLLTGNTTTYLLAGGALLLLLLARRR